jgi:hypothetical protein
MTCDVTQSHAALLPDKYPHVLPPEFWRPKSSAIGAAVIAGLQLAMRLLAGVTSGRSHGKAATALITGRSAMILVCENIALCIYIYLDARA